MTYYCRLRDKDTMTVKYMNNRITIESKWIKIPEEFAGDFNKSWFDVIVKKDQDELYFERGNISYDETLEMLLSAKEFI